MVPQAEIDPVWIYTTVVVVNLAYHDVIVQARGPFIYYLDTSRGKGGLKIAIFTYFQFIKNNYVRGDGRVKKSFKCVYVIYEWCLM